MNPTKPQSLELFFIDGKPDGMLTAEVFNWTGHVLMPPPHPAERSLEAQQIKPDWYY